MLVIRAIIILCVPVIIDASIWGYWGSCGKTCGIGTQIRQRINSAGNVLESEKQYCNTQPCPVAKTCRSHYDCPNYGECRNNTCHCTGDAAGKGFNTFSCLPQQGNCAILKNPPTASGYKDPSVKYPGTYDYPLYSCTTNDNPKYEVHVVSLKGNYKEFIYKISIVPRGPVVKPIILVLTSELWTGSTQWMIETPVGINKVLYGGRANPSTVGKQNSSKCEFRAFQRIDWIKYTGYGTDEYTSELLRSVT
ncbi:unnamed protein product [Mytilus edulis]|uniref:Uncharacterized protein n=1 Tax=Mytilus edulis TaxID=6550 RepID=A0A8S3Q5K1_MYTED|nr:unnamed protein product [Mytilus edulis]